MTKCKVVDFHDREEPQDGTKTTRWEKVTADIDE
jgi:hypothetical protein